MKTIVFAAAFLAAVYVARAVECPPENEADVTLLPNPEDCSTFYICNDGIPYLMSCPAGLNFNSRLRVCDLPENAQCVPSTTEQEPEEPVTVSESPDTPASNATEVEEPVTVSESPDTPVSNVTEVEEPIPDEPAA